ncbi:MAG: hypothetical protein C0507_10885 [Cyanobacteria bacterium PR.3.49]|nr:hypothetical protein [Cyanobacteria bacterium PR.3.49]
MHEAPHPRAGHTITVDFGEGPHQAGYDYFIHGNSYELGDWLDRISLDERISKRAMEVGIQFYANRCRPNLPPWGVTEQMLGDTTLVYCLHPVEFEGRKSLEIIVLNEHEWT